MSRSTVCSVYKRLLRRSLHKSTKVHLMVYDPSPEIYIQVMTLQKAQSRCRYLLSFHFSCSREHFLSERSLHAKCINFILQMRDTCSEATPNKTFEWTFTFIKYTATKLPFIFYLHLMLCCVNGNWCNRDIITCDRSFGLSFALRTDSKRCIDCNILIIT